MLCLEAIVRLSKSMAWDAGGLQSCSRFEIGLIKKSMSSPCACRSGVVYRAPS